MRPQRRRRWGFSWGFPYRFLPELLAGECQMGPNGGPKRLKLRKTLHLADSIRCGNRSRENPPPGTSLSPLKLRRMLCFFQFPVCRQSGNYHVVARIETPTIVTSTVSAWIRHWGPMWVGPVLMANALCQGKEKRYYARTRGPNREIGLNLAGAPGALPSDATYPATHPTAA